MRGRVGVVICFLVLSLCVGCAVTKKEKDGMKELDFTIVEEDDIPDEMKALIEARKEEPFRLTWGDGEYLYIGQGYGEKATGGYQILVDSCQETENAIYIHTTLQGPVKGENISETPSFPYVVIQVEWKDKHVVFQENKEE
ncbi:MAG: protease complex subunit PrcB family protein [Bariatricus sp.]